jgi:peptidylprolyl isomerase
MRRAAAALGALMALASPAAAQSDPPGPGLADQRVLLRTSRGDLVLGLYQDVAPRHVEQILRLVRLGVYDSTWFHRVEPGFLVQLSNAQNRRVPMSAAQERAIRKLPAELSKVLHQRGIVSMAREEDDPDSAETSFSILLAGAPHLDGKYTIVGQLVWGEDVLDLMAASERDAANQPFDEIRVESAVVKTAAEIDQMRSMGQLRAAIPPVPSARTRAGPPQSSAVVAAGIGVMMLLSLFGFLLAGRLPPHRVSAFSLLTVLAGAFLLMRELAPRAKGSAVFATAVFFGIVALFKLMNRFEAARPPAKPAEPTTEKSAEPKPAEPNSAPPAQAG